MPAHVTVLYPFVPPAAIDEAVLARLGRAVATVSRFKAEWPTTGWFGTDVHDAPIGELLAAEADVTTHLPIRMDVTTIQVMAGSNAQNSWRTIAELPLG